MGLSMQRCRRCSHVRFPPAALCPRCHDPAHDITGVEHGVVEEVTVQSGPPRLTLASIRTDAGPIVIARLTAPTDVGDRVLITTDLSDDRAMGAVVPHP